MSDAHHTPSDASGAKSEQAPDSRHASDWTQRHVWQIQPVRDLLILAAILGMVWLGYRLSIVTVPLLLALMLAYLVEPLVSRVTRTRWASRSGVALALIVLGGIAVLLPVTLGVGYGVAQGTQLVRRTTQKVDLLVKSVNAPEDEMLRERLPEKSWRRIRDYIVEQEAARRHLESQADEEMEKLLAGPVGKHLPTDGGASDDVAKNDADVAQVTPTDVSASDAKDTAKPKDADERWNDPAFVAIKQASEKPSYLPPEVYSGLMWLVERVRNNAETLGKRALEAGGDAIGGAVSVFGSIGAVLFGAGLT
ncbi:MAG TPA: hypothetical protein VK157_10665, partial [Phycisphaerales bacterium]|nr:hypothetical protein [Phycisphaerales bacterium]